MTDSQDAQDQNETGYDVLGIGNAIMDIIAPVCETTRTSLGIAKGAMTLINQERAFSLHSQLELDDVPLKEIAGGSAANTLVGIASLGLNAGYIGKVADDALGTRFAQGLRDAGVAYDTPPLEGDEATARCFVAVTPDGERSMSTFLGASVKFGKKDVVKSWIENARITYLEGYLFDSDDAKTAFVKAAELTRASKGLVALTLSDSFCVDRHRESFRHLVDNHVDILFANESELLSLFEQNDFESALKYLETGNKIYCITRSEKGSVILAKGTRYDIPASPVDEIVDTTGAGDQYAAGVMAGYLKGLSWSEAGFLGSRCAAEVISHYGARPEAALTIE